MELTVSEPVPAICQVAGHSHGGAAARAPRGARQVVGVERLAAGELTVVLGKRRNSCMLVLARMMAPAERSCATTKASWPGCAPSSDREPPVVGRSAVL